MSSSTSAAFDRRVISATAWLAALLILPGTSRTTDLPVPCAAGACGATGPATWVTSGQATAAYSGNTATITQTSDRAILNWATFNVGKDGHVIFQQPNGSSVALNRIFQDSPSKIFGEIKANGEIYLINPNGILFGPGSTVNVAGLLASTLGISNNVFGGGLLAPQLLQGITKVPVLEWADLNTAMVDHAPIPKLAPDGTPIPAKVEVANGASLSAPGGRILLAGPTVTNAGSIQTPDGQTILAAGTKVYLQASHDIALRGLFVEVDSGGTAWNQMSGQISAPRGDITLVGLAVNQDGRISATTTVSANGSVRLLARDTLVASSDLTIPISASHGGQLKLGSGSSITIAPELTSTATAIDKDQAQLQSSIQMSGQQIFLHGAQIVAPDGILDVEARANPSTPLTGGDPNSKIRIDQGTTIDLSGSNIALPMSNNVVRVELRANELADDPTQRNGALRGQTVYVDRRVGSTIANVQDAIAAVPKSVGERTAKGGNAKFISDGDVAVDSTASVNVSGGAITYDGGLIQTTQLVGADGRMYDIGTADPLMTYRGLVNPTVKQTYDRWGVTTFVPVPGTGHFEPTYVQGQAAGSVQFAAPNLVLNGTLKGNALNGPYQRSAATQNPGGLLKIGLDAAAADRPQNPTNPAIVDYLAPSVTLVSQATPVVIADDAQYSGAASVALPISYLGSGGFTRFQIFSNGQVTVPTGLPLNLAAGSSFAVTAPRIEDLSNITALGGGISFTSVATAASMANPSSRPGIVIGDNVTLDVRGTWTNDLNLTLADAPTTPTLLTGGSINLTLQARGSELVLGNFSNLRVSGGAWLQSTGQLSPGAGGSIALNSGVLDSAFQVGAHVGIDGFGAAGASGGKFSLEATRLKVAQGGADWAGAQRTDEQASPGRSFVVGAPLFSNYGFSTINLSATGPASGSKSEADRNVFEVAPGTAIVARAQSLQITNDALGRASGGTFADFSQPITLADYLRSPMNVSLQVAPRVTDPVVGIGGSPLGQLTFSTGASLVADTGVVSGVPQGSSVLLSSTGGISLQGTVRAPAGKVILQITPPPDLLNYDPGYRADQLIELGSNSLIDVHGASVMTPSDTGLLNGTVLPGGTVSLLANRGSVVARPHSRIDVSGTAAALDLVNGATGGYAQRLVSSAGGAVNVLAAETFSLQADLLGAAGIGDGVPSPGASLSLSLTRNAGSIPAGPSSSTFNAFPATPRVVQLTANAGGDAVSPIYGGIGIFSVASLAQSGFDTLAVQADDRIELHSFVDLSLARQLRLDAPVIAGTGAGPVTLSAPSVTIGNSNRNANTAKAVHGGGSLAVSGDYIELLGSSVWQGFDRVALNSTGDVQLRGISPRLANPNPATSSGGVSLAADLTINAARIYPTTETQFSINVQGTGRGVHFGQTGASPGTPLSVAGSLSVVADSIINDGTLLAPFGSLILNATHDLTLGDHSLTSVSGDQTTFLFGQIQNGTQWIYSPEGGSTGTTISGVPARQIQLNAPSVRMSNSATVDLRGGGDLYAYAFLPGTGGSHDALATTAAATGLFAVLPSMRGQYAPYDPQEYVGSTLRPGDSVYLSGGGGLAAGVYPLLPARYALLPGAYLVSSVPGFQDIVAGQSAALADGTAVAAGYLTFGNTGIGASPQGQSRLTGFSIRPGSYGRSLASYQDAFASTYFNKPVTAASGATPPTLPADAGSLSITVGAILDAQAAVLSAPAGGGRAATIELSATDLEIVGGKSPPSSGPVQIAGSVLQSWHAGQLLIGGRHSADNSSTDVFANSVTVDNGVNLTADQIAIVAKQAIDVKSGATIASTSGRTGKALSSLPTPSSMTLTNPDTAAPLPGAALLAVSDSTALNVHRATTDGSIPATISLEAGSTITSHGSFTVDGGGSVLLAGTIQAPGARWSLASNTVAFVPARTGSAGLEIAPSLLSDLQLAKSLRLSSAGSIDFALPVSLGAAQLGAVPTLDDLTLIGTSISTSVPGNQVLLGAHTLTLQGQAPVVNASSVVAGTGQLSLLASQLNLGPNVLAVNGFGQTNAVISGQAIGRGAGGLIVGGDLSVAATSLTAEHGAASLLSAPNGVIRVSRTSAGATSVAPPVFLGGGLTLLAQSIQDNGSIQAAGGSVALSATKQLTVGADASIDVGGVMVAAADRSVGANGGWLSLQSGGDLTAATGATLRVAGAGDANAGRIAIAAAGTATVSANLQGAAASSARGGAFSLDAGSLGNSATSLAASLDTGGFTESQSLRVRHGDLALTSGSTITARQVNLVADTGSIDLAGTITAPSAGLQSGIRAYAGQGITVEGALHADAVGTSGRGGNIELGTTAGTLTLAGNSVVSARGSSQSGELRLRAPAIGGSDVAITTLPSDVSGVGQIVIEPVLTPFQVSNAPTAADLNQIDSTVGAYMSSAGATIRGRLGASGTPVLVQPGIELQQAGDLTLNNPLNLSAWRFDGQPAALTVRVGGALNVNGTISDGFATTRTGRSTRLSLLDQQSATLRFVAGADLSSADPLATLTGAAADLTVGPNVAIRTGTGSIALRASQNVNFMPGSTVFTAGLPGAAQKAVGAGFVFDFPTHGGDVSIVSGKDIVGSAAMQGVTAWQPRQGTAKNPAQWGVDFAKFGWNAGALGGGDLVLSAGHDILDITGAAADSRFVDAGGAASAFGGGGLSVSAGHDVASGQFFIAKGTGVLDAGGSFSVRRPDASLSHNLLGSLLNIGDAQVSITARGDITLEGALNPQALSQPTGGRPFPAPLLGRYYTYSGQSQLRVQSTDGNIAFYNDGARQTAFLGEEIVNASDVTALTVAPPSLTTRALLGDVTFGGTGVVLYPSALGQLEVFAGRDISSSGGATVTMSDVAASAIPTVATPGAGNISNLINVTGSARHGSDTAPVLFTAGRDVNDLHAIVPKSTRLTAGRDVVNLWFEGQNLRASDETLISAARDFIYQPDNSTAGVSIGGPGRLDVLAGRNVDLGFSRGLVTVGALVNPNLPVAAGADLTVLAGLGQSPDYAGFLTQIIAPSTDYQAQLVQYVQTDSGTTGLTFTQAGHLFQNFGADKQRPLIDKVFFSELVKSGREANTTPKVGFTRGYAAIDALFPHSRTATSSGSPSPYAGDLSLAFSRIYTLAGGNISLLVPGGLLNVGLATPPQSVLARPPSELGIVAQGSGSVDIYTKGDVLVNSSRIFTLLGGDIAVWSTEGNIDAGRGAKSAVSAPPPTVQVDATGKVTLNFAGAVAGSGIRTIATDPSLPPGNVDLIAPVGFVNAGDAGIGSAGNINIAAQQVIGLDNINFGGAATGVPAQVSNLGASLSGASSTAASTSNASASAAESSSAKEAAAPLAQSALTWLDVFVTGLGEDNCKQDDVECLKRQKTRRP